MTVICLPAVTVSLDAAGELRDRLLVALGRLPGRGAPDSQTASQSREGEAREGEAREGEARECQVRGQETGADAVMPVEIDASAVQQLTTPGLQLLLAFARQAEDDGIRWSLLSPSAEFVSAMEDFGLFSTLMMWPVSARAASAGAPAALPGE